ncbi:MAG: elongation factor P [Planctomycetota bacterium]|jgi:elongation factor P
MIETTDFKKGVCLIFKDEPCIIVDYTVSTPTARGGNTIYKTKLRNLKTGQLYTDAIRSGEKFADVDLERHNASYLYNDGARWYFMDDESYEQFDLGKDDLGGDELYITDGVEGIQAMLIDGVTVSIQLPTTVALEVTATDPSIKGATAQAQLKPAVCSTGLTVPVPAYVEVGTRIKVDTRDCRFLEREK